MTDSNDETILLAEEVGRLREALTKAENDANSWQDKAVWRKRQFQVANFWAWMVGVALVGAIGGLAVYPAYMGITSQNRITHCYVTISNVNTKNTGCPCVKLQGNIDWRTDATLGTYATLEMAIEAAKVLQCPLRATDP